MQCCKNNHPLLWRVDDEGYMAGRFSCDQCHQSANCKDGRWSCKGCSYDICPKCMPSSTCNNNHGLVWSIDTEGYMAGRFSCDGCKQSSGCADGRWSCKACSYDICPKCKAAPPHYLCAKGHILNWSTGTDGYMAGKFSCDECKKSNSCEAGRWSCKACSYDICPKCRPSGPYPACGKSHPLAWSTSTDGYMAGKFSCDGCKQSNSCEEGRWSCKECSYDICTKCRKPQYLVCKNNHGLAWSTNADGYMAGKFSCDICHKPSQCETGRWSCKPCGFDICVDCRSAPFLTCKTGHILAYSADGTGYVGGKYSCDKCHTSYPCEDGRYTCSCQYDICPKCKGY